MKDPVPLTPRKLGASLWTGPTWAAGKALAEGAGRPFARAYAVNLAIARRN